MMRPVPTAEEADDLLGVRVMAQQVGQPPLQLGLRSDAGAQRQRGRAEVIGGDLLEEHIDAWIKGGGVGPYPEMER